MASQAKQLAEISMGNEDNSIIRCSVKRKYEIEQHDCQILVGKARVLIPVT